MKAILVFFVFAAVLLVSPSSANEDPCSQWPTCQICISHNLCGWCSNNVIYQDGTKGTHCAGFNSTDPKSKPFRCEGRYQTSACTAGYLCNSTTYQCYKTEPGSGDDLSVCESKCVKPPATYDCDYGNHTCFETTPGHGTSLPVCQQSCFQGYSCAPQNFTCVPSNGGSHYEDCSASCGKHSNVTPSDVIGTWRGLQVNLGYFRGEFDFVFNDSSVIIQFPKESGVVLVGSVSTILNPAQIWIYVTSGPSSFKDKTLRGIYSINYAPEVEVYTFAFGGPDQPAPLTFDAAMKSANSESVFVVGKCLNPQICNFHLNGLKELVPNKKSLSLELNSLVNNLGINDTCMQYNTCQLCIGSGKYCGWCSNDVKYDDGTTGKHCAGFNPDGSKNPFTCDGTYSTEFCPTPSPNSPTAPVAPAVPASPAPVIPALKPTVAPTYICNHEKYTCEQTTPGHGESLPVCKQICVPPGNNTPVALIGKWRGIQVNLDYLYGEFDVTFNASSVSFTYPNETTWTAIVSGDAAQLWITPVSGPYAGYTIKGIWQIAYAVETKEFTWAWGVPGGPSPGSFAEAMSTAGQAEYLFVGCISSLTCNFDH